MAPSLPPLRSNRPHVRPPSKSTLRRRPLETGREPAISGRDNLKTMALVEAAYLSAAEHRAVAPSEILSPK